MTHKIPQLIQLLQNVKQIKARDLAKALNVSERELRSLISYVRLNVSPRIISGDFGYRYCEDETEIVNSWKRLQSHAVSELQLISRQRKMLQEENYKINRREAV